MNMKTQILTGILASILAGCVTTGPVAQEKTAVKGDAVVTQSGKANPVVSGHDRRYWLDLRQAKATLPKMSGALATGEAAAALELARSFLEKNPGNPDALTLMATALAMSKNYDLAAYYAALVEKARPGDVVALNIRGMAAMLQPKARIADFKKAEALFAQAFNGDQSQIAAGLNLGSLQLEVGNAAAAAATFGEVAKRCHQCTVGLMGYGIASARSKKFDQAKGAFEAVLKKNPIHAGALYQLALVHKNGYNNGKQAEKYLEKILVDARIKDPAAKERAQTVLRSVKAEATPEERTMIADDKDADADELLMTSGQAGDNEE
jgi:tetratricopeptide (TPR) repeat protein